MAVTRLLIDGDGCPVVREAVAMARCRGIPCVIFCDTAHRLELAGAKTVIVSKGADSADFALLGRIRPGDLVITQDYALAALCLTRGAQALNQDGRDYTGDNVDALLYARYLHGKARRAGERLKGPRKRTPEQTAQFCRRLAQLMEKKT